MIKEFAIDPSLFADVRTAQFLFAVIGLDNGRLVSDYPQRWQRMVSQSIKASELQPVMKKTLKNRLSKISRGIFRNPYREDSGMEWGAQVLDSHRETPFAAVISEEGDADTVSMQSILDDECEQWSVPSDHEIERRAEHIVDALMPLLRLSRKAAIVDKHLLLLGHRERFDRTLRELISKIENLSKLRSLYVHTSAQEPVNAAKQFVNQPIAIPDHLTIKWHKWHPNALHDRYLVTDAGSIDLGHGFDEKRAMDGTATDYVHLHRVGEQVHRALVTRYLDDIDQDNIDLDGKFGRDSD